MFVPVERCPICGEVGNHYKSEDGVSVDKCLECETIYQNPRMSDDTLREYYKSGEYQEQSGKASRRWESKRAERLTLTVEQLRINPKSCLDIGCGHGYLLKHLEVGYFARIQGIEFDTELPSIDEVVSSKEEVQDKFDLITCIHVLEHMVDPGKELEWMVSKLNEGGTIMVEVPVKEDLSLPHLHIFSAKALRLMLEKLDLPNVILRTDHACLILIGKRYRNAKKEKVYFSFDSPDFATREEYNLWLSNSYE